MPINNSYNPSNTQRRSVLQSAVAAFGVTTPINHAKPLKALSTKVAQFNQGYSEKITTAAVFPSMAPPAATRCKVIASMSNSAAATAKLSNNMVSRIGAASNPKMSASNASNAYSMPNQRRIYPTVA